jgi:hypothetical protein
MAEDGSAGTLVTDYYLLTNDDLSGTPSDALTIYPRNPRNPRLVRISSCLRGEKERKISQDRTKIYIFLQKFTKTAISGGSFRVYSRQSAPLPATALKKQTQSAPFA